MGRGQRTTRALLAKFQHLALPGFVTGPFWVFWEGLSQLAFSRDSLERPASGQPVTGGPTLKWVDLGSPLLDQCRKVTP